jgi:mono/diheme cytochrome c family protein
MIYLDPEEVNFRPKLFDKKFVGGLVFLALFTSFSVYMHMNKLLYLPPFDWMMEQPRIDAQEPNPFFSNNAGMVEPLKTTVPRGFMPYKYTNDPQGSSALRNPFIADSANLAMGKIKYDIFCSMCHGYNADGQMRLTDAYIGNPPSLHSNKVKEWSDGEIYHVITAGQNIMQSYAGQITPEERWAIVNYVRALQRAFDAEESDLQ